MWIRREFCLSAAATCGKIAKLSNTTEESCELKFLQLGSDIPEPPIQSLAFFKFRCFTNTQTSAKHPNFRQTPKNLPNTQTLLPNTWISSKHPNFKNITMPPRNKPPTAWEIAKPILQSHYLDGTVTDAMKPKEVWQMQPEFSAVQMNFFTNLFSLVEMTSLLRLSRSCRKRKT